jgi:glycine oxidase
LDVVVMGAGIVGCAVARRLAGEGARVRVIDRDEPGKHASWAAAGMLAPQAEADRDDPFLRMLLRARELFPALVPELREETGIDVGYRAEGALLIALSEADEHHLRRRFEWQRGAGLEVEMLSAEETLRLEPSLTPDLRLALRFPGDHQVDNRLLTRALELSAARRGAEFRIGGAARRILLAEAGCAVELEGGEKLEADAIVLAAGCWSGELDGLPRPVPVIPVHGQMISLEMAPPLMRHVVGSGGGYMVPRADGRLVVGTTVERQGFRVSTTAGGMNSITAAALEMAPGLAGRPLVAHWAGLRPGTPDALPILGPDPDFPRLVYATGHFRNGILLAPLTAEIVAAVVLGREVALEPFGIGRF